MTAVTVREEQIPAEFLYWQHVNSRRVQRARRVRRTLWGFDPQPSDELGAHVFRRYGTSVFSFATTSTLEIYSESSVAKPLSLAGGGDAEFIPFEEFRQ